MAYFNLENELSNALRLDVPLKEGPVPRWQRKQKDKSPDCNLSNTSVNTSSTYLNISANKSISKVHVSPFKGLYYFIQIEKPYFVSVVQKLKFYVYTIKF